MTDHPAHATRPRPPASDVVVFDIMRDSLTVVMGDYSELIGRAQAAGRDDEAERLLDACHAVRQEVKKVNARDRDEQTAMTERLRALHAKLQTQIYSQ